MEFQLSKSVYWKVPSAIFRIAIATCIFISPIHTLAGKTEASLVDPSKLLALIARADRLVIYHMPTGEIVYSSSNLRDLSELKAAVSVDPSQPWFKCACMPSTEIRLFRANRQIGEIYVHDEMLSLGYSQWSSDGLIKDQEKWLKWFDDRGISHPRKEFDRAKETERESEAAYARWLSAMPSSLHSLWPKVMEEERIIPGRFDTTELSIELAKEYPEAGSRIRALMSWFGAGAGPWSGFPAYEEVASEMLLTYSPAELVAAIQAAPLDKQETEGAARLFASWDYHQRHPGDLSLPVELSRAFLEHSLKSSDEDKVARARNAFGPKGSK